MCIRDRLSSAKFGKFANILAIFKQKFELIPRERFDSKTVQRSAFCRSRRELSNAYLLATFPFDTAEKEPWKVCPIEPSRCHDGSALLALLALASGTPLGLVTEKVRPLDGYVGPGSPQTANLGRYPAKKLIGDPPTPISSDLKIPKK